MAPELEWSSVGNYLEGLVPERPPELQTMEAYAQEHHFPIIGPVCGQICYQIARLLGAQRIFELGSGYGYSTAWFARAVQENGGGVVHHVVWDENLSNRARQHLNALGYGDIVRYHVGEAVQTLRGVDGSFDLIFNDIDKQMYPGSIPPIVEKLRPGGVLIIDNILWSGRILDDSEQDESTQGVREVTRMLTASNDWISSIVPVRHGLIVAMRR